MKSMSLINKKNQSLLVLLTFTLELFNKKLPLFCTNISLYEYNLTIIKFYDKVLQTHYKGVIFYEETQQKNPGINFMLDYVDS